MTVPKREMQPFCRYKAKIWFTWCNIAFPLFSESTYHAIDCKVGREDICLLWCLANGKGMHFIQGLMNWYVPYSSSSFWQDFWVWDDHHLGWKLQTNPNLGTPLLFFPTNHIIVNLFEKCCEIHGKNISFKIDVTSHRKEDNPNSISNTYISSTICLLMAESVTKGGGSHSKRFKARLPIYEECVSHPSKPQQPIRFFLWEPCLSHGKCWNTNCKAMVPCLEPKRCPIWVLNLVLNSESSNSIRPCHNLLPFQNLCLYPAYCEWIGIFKVWHHIATQLLILIVSAASTCILPITPLICFVQHAK